MAGPMDHGIIAYAAYLPGHRLPHRELGGQLGAGSGDGSRILASYDEDATTMAVEVARRVVDPAARPRAIYFATTTPPYLDKTNAAAIHAALDPGRAGFAVDMAGSARSAVGASRAGAASGGLAVMGDVITGLPGSADERDGADGAAAFLFGPADEAAVEMVSSGSATAEFLDRWRLPGEKASHRWEERFGLEMYMPLVQEAVSEALAGAGLEGTDHVVVSSPHARTAAAARKQLGAAASPEGLGYAGAADIGLRIAAVLDSAGPGETTELCDADHL